VAGCSRRQVVYKKPVIVYNYPCAIKSFYMRRNAPGTDGAPGPTCAAMDVLVPGVGELIGGSVRPHMTVFLNSTLCRTVWFTLRRPLL
jgi:asparaginyl-tRNA synthetase